MNRDLLISALAALGCHALLLFGLRMHTSPAPLPVADHSVEVSLVEAAPSTPEPPAAEAAPPPPAVPEPIPAPPVPEPITIPPPESKPEPIPKPRVAEAQRKPPARPAKPGPSTTARTGRPEGTSGSATGTGPGDTKPRYRSNPRPAYPIEARQQKQQGRVILDVEVGADGRPTSVSLKRSSGFPALDSAALAAVRRWTFEPARTAGVPVAARVEVPVQFDLAR